MAKIEPSLINSIEAVPRKKEKLLENLFIIHIAERLPVLRLKGITSSRPNPHLLKQLSHHHFQGIMG
jgi:hypothetical protein